MILGEIITPAVMIIGEIVWDADNKPATEDMRMILYVSYIIAVS